jgi:hypothetical protein
MTVLAEQLDALRVADGTMVLPLRVGQGRGVVKVETVCGEAALGVAAAITRRREARPAGPTDGHDAVLNELVDEPDLEASPAGIVATAGGTPTRGPSPTATRGAAPSRDQRGTPGTCART